MTRRPSGSIDSIIETSKTPYAALHDIDANKPSGSIKIRVKTYAHALKLHEERLQDATRRKGELMRALDHKRLGAARVCREQLASRSQTQAPLILSGRSRSCVRSVDFVRGRRWLPPEPVAPLASGLADPASGKKTPDGESFACRHRESESVDESLARSTDDDALHSTPPA